jgi:hypothetical protein
MARPEPAPDRDGIREDEFQYWDGVVEREGNRGQLGPDGKLGGYYGALLNAPGLCFHINAMGRIVRNVGSHPGSYSHADREWVDQVLSIDWKSNTVLASHIPDALAVGVRLDAIIALREGREDELTADERLITEYIRSVRDGTVTGDLHERMVARLGVRGTTEYAAFIMFLVLTIRLIEATTGATGLSDEEITQLLQGYKDGTTPIPTEILIRAG